MYIKATTLPDLWFQAVYNVLDHGTRKTVDVGSYAGSTRIEYKWFAAEIKNPGSRPLLPEIPDHLGLPDPVDKYYLDSYVQYIMTDIINPEEQYTYGQRIASQITRIIKGYRDNGHCTNQMVLRISQPSDLYMSDPPCLQLIDTKIEDGNLCFYPYFRSWELWAGLPANLAALQILKEYMAAEIGVDDGPMYVSSKGLHIYGYAEELVKRRCGK